MLHDVTVDIFFWKCNPSHEKGRVGCHIVSYSEIHFFRFLNREFYDESRNINMLVGS